MIEKYLKQLSPEGPFILLFHGVVRENNYAVRNYIRKHIEADYFAALMKELSAHGTALSMDDIVEIYHSGEDYPPNSFAVTFDDGFENNYSVAAPILDDLDIPAAFYMTTDFIANGTMSWTDKAEYALEQVSSGAVCLPWETQKRRFKNAEEKIALMKAVRHHVFHHEDVNVHDFNAWFFDTLGVNAVNTTDDPLDLKLSWDQVREMDQSDLFTIGGHTHTHIIMAFEQPQVMEAEVDLNLKLLRENSGVETAHYAYPQGQSNHYNETVVKALKDRGIVCSPTAIEGQNTKDTGLFDLYRTMII